MCFYEGFHASLRPTKKRTPFTFYWHLIQLFRASRIRKAYPGLKYFGAAAPSLQFLHPPLQRRAARRQLTFFISLVSSTCRRKKGDLIIKNSTGTEMAGVKTVGAEMS
uniref:Uncharacterized protein n=1 Tax=Romanomermis culicivorax TaxID=13658 RepID=A0A915JKN2_ROMCU